VIIKYYFLVTIFYFMELALFYFLSQFNLVLIETVNIISRVLIAIIAGYVYFFYLFNKKTSFLLKYVLSIIFYPLFVTWIYEALTTVNFLNIFSAKVLLDLLYSLIFYGIFNFRLSPKIR